MINSEYIKSMNCNFERVKLEEAPEEKRYQYCIINRGGISGLLPCSLRLINGEAYLYYDITSKQGLNQIFRKKAIGRQWIKDFVWNMKRISKELNRFLLDETNVIWYPDNIFQDLEDNRWSFLYYPYYKGDNGFRELMEFIIEKIDYKDEALVEFVYKMYEQYDNYGNDYLAEKIYQDVDMLVDTEEVEEIVSKEIVIMEKGEENSTNQKEEDDDSDEENTLLSVNYLNSPNTLNNFYNRIKTNSIQNSDNSNKAKEKKGLLAFLEGAKRRDKTNREELKARNHYQLDTGDEYDLKHCVAEEAEFYKISSNDKEVGRTTYIEKVAEEVDSRRRIYDTDGKMMCLLEENSVVIGKKKDEADMVIENSSVSRVHARIFYADGDYILEDLNSTNGTFKNGMRLKPYEQRKLMRGDEIKLGSVALMYN